MLSGFLFFTSYPLICFSCFFKVTTLIFQIHSFFRLALFLSLTLVENNPEVGGLRIDVVDQIHDHPQLQITIRRHRSHNARSSDKILDYFQLSIRQ